MKEIKHFGRRMLTRISYIVNELLGFSKSSGKPLKLGVLIGVSMTAVVGCTLRYRSGEMSSPIQSGRADEQSRFRGIGLGSFGGNVSPARIPESAAPYARPITPTVIEEFPHLNGFEGNILLGNGLIQIVMAGVTPSRAKREELDLILAFFERRGPLFARLAPIERVVAVTNQSIVPVAMDTTLHEGTASVRLLFAREDKSGNQAAAEKQWRFDLAASSRTLGAHWEKAEDGETPTLKDMARRGPRSDLPWSLRVYAAPSGLIVQPTPPPIATENGSSPTAHKALSYLRVSGDDALGIVATNPFRVKSEKNTDVLASTESSPVRETIDFVVGGAAASSLLVRTEAWQKCLAEMGKAVATDSASLAKALGCASRFAINGVDLRLWHLDAQNIWLPRGALLTGSDGVPVGFTILGTAQTPWISQVPVGLPLKVVSLAHYGLEGREMSIQKNQAVPIEVPPFHTGTVFVDLRNSLGVEMGWDFPVLAKLEALRQGTWMQNFVKESNAIVLARGRLLVSRWPLKLELPVGDYNIEFARGPFSCSESFVVKAGETARATCRVKEKSLDEGVSFLQIDLGMVADEFSQYILSQAAGASLLSSDVGAGKAQASTRLIPSLRVPVGNGGMVLSVLPADATFIDVWRQRRRAGERGDAKELVDFLKMNKNERWVMLSCPTLGTLIEDYESILLRLKPDAVQITGCFENPDLERTYFLSVMDHIVRQNSPVAILPIAAKDFAGNGVRAPVVQVSLDGQENPSHGKVMEALRLGRFQTSSGARLKWALTGRGKQKGAALTVKWVLADDVQPKRLVVHTEDRKRQMFELPGKGAEELDIPVGPKSRWYCLELQGIRLSNRDGGDITLAITPVFSLSESK